jgi:hypothetical protein
MATTAVSPDPTFVDTNILIFSTIPASDWCHLPYRSSKPVDGITSSRLYSTRSASAAASPLCGGSGLPLLELANARIMSKGIAADDDHILVLAKSI